jgi:hypothetical protein
MKTQRLADQYTMFSFMTLFTLSALGNALALFLAALLGLAFGMLLMRRNVTIGGVTLALLGCACALAVSLFRLM